ncbi:hypothetical protein [Pandoraea anhela]|uniref:hypothetical protein n=1 Tax=Pandoraea anhela TaxID=2508295 RepID=UPI00123FDF91|nr:hypothetical protein [Pandoraea anhela]
MNDAVPTKTEPETAEQRFRSAFERLRDDRPLRLPRGTSVSQNNVAREAGTDPTALRKKRFPALVREIQAWIQIHSERQKTQQASRKRERRKREDLEAQVMRLRKERDDAQSQLTSAHRLVLEVLQKNALLQSRLDELRPPPTPLREKPAIMDIQPPK